MFAFTLESLAPALDGEPDEGVGKTTEVGTPVRPRLANGVSTEGRVARDVVDSSDVGRGKVLSMIVDNPTMMGAELELPDMDPFTELEEVRAVGEGSLDGDCWPPVRG